VAVVACPYFFPTEKSSNILWAFPQRLPLGAGFCGLCLAQGTKSTPTETELKEFCNLGYAGKCEKLPADRQTDSVRFSVASLEKATKDRLRLHYSCEQNHAPVEHGVLEYDCEAHSWPMPHNNACIQQQAECYVATYLERQKNRVIG